MAISFTVSRILSRVISVLYLIFGIALVLLCSLILLWSVLIEFFDEDSKESVISTFEKELSLSGEGLLWTVFLCSVMYLVLAVIITYASLELFRATAKNIPVETAIVKAEFFRNVAIVVGILMGFLAIMILPYEAIMLGVSPLASFLMLVVVVCWYIGKLDESRKKTDVLENVSLEACNTVENP